MRTHQWLLLAVLCMANVAQAVVLEAVRVAEGVYALVGSTQGRTPENHALNMTLGFVVTADGVALVDSGASNQGAALIEAEVRKISQKPIRWVINLGVQDHRWLGNGYFASKGAKITALQRTVASQEQYSADHVAMLKNVLKDRFDGTRPVTATEPFASDTVVFDLGGTRFELRWLGDAHYRGDAVLYLPQTGVLFAGDLVFNDRMLGVWPHSPVDAWRDTFRAMERLEPKIVVPGHGHPGDLAKARRDTGDYLDFLADTVIPAARDWEPLDAVIARLAEQPRFKHLEHYEGWHKRNMNQTYIQFEGK
jgi:glyoxylase-like metal-dependent hydrolase (beta-lactamase superfamily II)